MATNANNMDTEAGGANAATEITLRFFRALRSLIDLGLMRGKQTFTRAYGINRRNMIAVERGGFSQKYAQLEWLVPLVRDCGVSARWLLTGEGEMFDREPSPPKPPSSGR